MRLGLLDISGLCAALTALALLPLLAWAQTPPEEDEDAVVQATIPLPTAVPRAPPLAAELEELVVTATPSRDTLSQTPISVSITSDTELRETNITDLEVLADRLPNAQLALTPTNTFFFVRGLGTGSVRSAEQSVGFFVDSVFLGRPQVALFDFLDLDQVELLRGPQGAILGKNTVAGAVNVLTAPATFTTEGYLEAYAGSDGQRRGRGALSGPLTDSLAGRIAYTDIQDDGFLFNTTQQRTDLARPGRSGRAKLLWEPRSDMRYGMTAQAARIRQVGDSFELSQASEQLLSVYRLYDPETSTDIRDNRTHTDHRNSGALVEGEDLILDAAWEADFGRLRFLGSFSEQDVLADFDLDISPAPLLNLPSVESYRQHSAELRFDDSFAWGSLSVGGYYFESDLDLDVDIVAFDQGGAAFVTPLLDQATGAGLGATLLQSLGALGPLLGPLFDPLTTAGLPDPSRLGRGASEHRLIQQQTTYSLFASLRWDLSPRWTLRLDGRWTEETKEADQGIEFTGLTGPLLGAALGEEEYQLDARRRETDFSPRLSVLTTFNPALSGYLTLARGFKSGGFNNLAAVPERAEFDEERSQTYEAGLRLRTNYGLRAELSLFRTDFDNLQVAALDGTEFFVGNAAAAHTQGTELSLQWYLGGGVLLGADVGYLDAEYDSYQNAPARADSEEDSQDLSGRTLQRAPEWSGSLQLGWATQLFGLPLTLGAVAEGASKQFLNIDLDPIDSQPGYVRYNAFAAIEDADGRYTLRLIGRNLADTTVRREAADIALVGAHSVGVFPPRSYGAELGYRF